jgi:hypothetical protein
LNSHKATRTTKERQHDADNHRQLGRFRRNLTRVCGLIRHHSLLSMKPVMGQIS